ncbi:MAG: helix-hairpin-helix domain-containing protein [Chitinophagaceae bacterium]
MEKKDVKNWLSFSKRERNALIMLILLIGLFFLVPYLFPKKEIPKNVDGKTSSISPEIVDTDAVQLFPFDPNTIGFDGWKKLGLRDKTIQTIIHYREKGGRFRVPEDIRKIYGLHNDEAERLIPYIHIDASKQPIVTYTSSKSSKNQYSFPLEINKAGADHWAALPGISPALAQRIVHYRDAMHGFKSIDQVGKTYGLSPDVFNQIKPLLRLIKDEAEDTAPPVAYSVLTEKQAVAEIPERLTKVEKININTASEQEILAQKRIPKSVAKAIVIYREQHGNYQQVADIKKIVFVNEELYERVAPFLVVE